MRVLLITLLFFPSIVSGKEETCFKVDSAILIIFDDLTKEMITEKETPHHIELARKTLSKKEAQEVVKMFCKQNRLELKSTLLTHDNIYFEFYRDGTQLGELRISSLTRNLIFNTPAGYFHAGLNSKSENYIVDLLKKHRLYMTIEEGLRFVKD